MRIALVHDQLQEFGGAERVLVSLKKIFPESDVFTSFYNPHKLGRHVHHFEGWNIVTSWAQKVPFLNKLYSPLRFITPLIWNSFDLSGYDVVISSSGAYISKGVKTSGKTVHICYLHHQPKYLYGYETPSNWQKYPLIKIYGNFINHFLRMYDFQTSQKVDHFIVNSEETKRRCQKFYRRDAEVIYPPVSIPSQISNLKSQISNYFLTVSRLSGPKHIDLLVKAANEKKFSLKIVGAGKDEEKLKQIAGSTVEILGSVSDEELVNLYDSAKAFLFASVDEEFGIAPVEAMGYGVPVIAYSSGGLKETVKNGENGFLFEELSEKSLSEAIQKLERLSEEKDAQMRKNARKEAEKYSEEKFKERILKFVAQSMSSRT